ncbi:MAG: MazG nucleotide pyrophosphohydrolase domain-containing protein [Candidatus Hodarchaeales archaeon]|jgi:NTP pyrophosphatase (non-canonical NTP hydrolase)
MPSLIKNPPLIAYQKYVAELEQERDFKGQSVIEKCLLLGEEVGELFKAVRKKEGLNIDQNSNTSQVSYELVDIFIFLCAIANRYDINLEDAFRDKEKINKTRNWTK